MYMYKVAWNLSYHGEATCTRTFFIKDVKNWGKYWAPSGIVHQANWLSVNIVLLALYADIKVQWFVI